MALRDECESESVLDTCSLCLQRLCLPAVFHQECGCAICCQCAQGDTGPQHSGICAAVVSVKVPQPGIEVRTITDAQQHGLVSAVSVLQLPWARRGVVLRAILDTRKTRMARRSSGLWFSEAHRIRRAIQRVTSREHLGSVTIGPEAMELRVSP
jgi:hypothetical protein